MLGSELPLDILTESKQLFDAMTKGQQTTENLLMIDISAVRQAYRKFEISQVGLVSTRHNPADGLTKVKGNGALEKMLSTEHDTCPVEQWIIRQHSSHENEKKNVGV